WIARHATTPLPPLELDREEPPARPTSDATEVMVPAALRPTPVVPRPTDAIGPAEPSDTAEATLLAPEGLLASLAQRSPSPPSPALDRARRPLGEADEEDDGEEDIPTRMMDSGRLQTAAKLHGLGSGIGAPATARPLAGQIEAPRPAAGRLPSSPGIPRRSPT